MSIQILSIAIIRCNCTYVYSNHIDPSQTYHLGLKYWFWSKAIIWSPLHSSEVITFLERCLMFDKYFERISGRGQVAVASFYLEVSILSVICLLSICAKLILRMCDVIYRFHSSYICDFFVYHTIYLSLVFRKIQRSLINLIDQSLSIYKSIYNNLIQLLILRNTFTGN